MAQRIHIKDGLVVDPAQQYQAKQDVFIAEGKIVGLGTVPAGFVAEQTLAAQGKVVCPGFIDLCAQLGEPGHEYKGNLHSELSAAAKGGITTVCCLPNTVPVIDHPAVVEFIWHKAEKLGKSRVALLGALTRGLAGLQLSDMAALQQAGCVGVAQPDNSIKDTRILRRCFEYAATLGLTVFLFPADPWLSAEGCVHDGEIGQQLGLVGVPELAETIAVARDLLLIEETGARAHFMHLSTGRAVTMIAEAQARGLPVTAGVTAHHLHLTEQAVQGFNTQCHVCPPLRSVADQVLLLEGIKTGVITAVCSDHQPYEPDAKQVPFAQSAVGILGLETLLPLTLALQQKIALPLTKALALLTSGPAAILGLPQGDLALGKPADICILDVQQQQKIDPSQFSSRGKDSPFAGWQLAGKIAWVLRAGEIIYQS